MIERYRGENISCERDDRILFSGLNFDLAAGEVMRIHGPNGSGKTTLLRVLTTLARDFNGALFWGESPMDEVRSQFLAEMAFIGHDSGIQGQLTPLENLSWYCHLAGLPSQPAEIEQAIATIGLRGYGDVPCAQLSAGQKRRVALSRLILLKTPLWILDEPFTAIDAKGVLALEQLIQAHVQQAGSVILTTHQEIQGDFPVKVLDLAAFTPTPSF